MYLADDVDSGSWMFVGFSRFCFQFIWFETRRARVREEPLEPTNPIFNRSIGTCGKKIRKKTRCAPVSSNPILPVFVNLKQSAVFAMWNACLN
jgi:hypothetical protein